MSGSSEGVAIKKSARPLVTTGVALITAVALTFVPSVKDSQESARPAQTTSAARIAAAPIQLSAAVQPLATTTLPNLLVEWVDRIIVPPSAGAPFPTPEFPPVIGGTSVSSFIKNTYNAIEPWVQWGFELVAYGVGWVPYVGWLAPQIMIFYNLGERIVRSITFNIADWIGGQVSFAQGLINVGVDTINSFIFFVNDQLAFWLPPLPPFPPLPFATEATTADMMMATAVEETTEAAGAGQIEEPIDVVEPEATEDEGLADELATGADEAVVEEAVVEEAEPAATEPEVSEASAAELDANEPTTTSSETVEAQGEVRETGLNASPGEPADDPASADTGDADEPEAGTPEPENNKVSEPSPDTGDDSGSE